MAVYCAQHAPDGMVNVNSRNCRNESCVKKPSFGVADSKTVEYCAQQATDGIVDVTSRNYCKTEGCGKGPLFGLAGTKTVEYCVLTYDFITVSSAWELTSVSMRYSQGGGVNTSLSRISYCTHSYSCRVLYCTFTGTFRGAVMCCLGR